jgi:hypothetical protein
MNGHVRRVSLFSCSISLPHCNWYKTVKYKFNKLHLEEGYREIITFNVMNGTKHIIALCERKLDSCYVQRDGKCCNQSIFNVYGDALYKI